MSVHSHAVAPESSGAFFLDMGTERCVFQAGGLRNALRASEAVRATDVMFNPCDNWGGKREPQKIPPFRIVEFFGGVVRGMTTRQRLPHLSEALWRDAETPGNSATPVPGPQ